MNAWQDLVVARPARHRPSWAPLCAGPGDDDDEEETPIGDPEPDDWDGDDWEEDDDEPIHALPRPPKGPGDGDDDELPMGDPPDDDPTDDPDDEDEGEGDDEPLQGRSPRSASSAARQLQPRSR